MLLKVTANHPLKNKFAQKNSHKLSATTVDSQHFIPFLTFFGSFPGTKIAPQISLPFAISSTPEIHCFRSSDLPRGVKTGTRNERRLEGSRWKRDPQVDLTPRFLIFQSFSTTVTVDWRNPANQLIWYLIPLFTRVLHIRVGAGFLPSTVFTKSPSS